MYTTERVQKYLLTKLTYLLTKLTYLVHILTKLSFWGGFRFLFFF